MARALRTRRSSGTRRARPRGWRTSEPRPILPLACYGGPVSWLLLGGMAAALAFLAGRGLVRRRSQDAAADAAGLVPVRDLTHLPTSLQQSALWTMADGGFERRVMHGVIACGNEDTDVTAFDLETLRERRGEWAYLPVHPPFRIGGVVSIVA